MNNYFVDTHCHVFKSDYENIDEVLKNASNKIGRASCRERV